MRNRVRLLAVGAVLGASVVLVTPAGAANAAGALTVNDSHVPVAAAVVPAPRTAADVAHRAGVEPIAGIDVDQVLTDLGDDHVAVVGDADEQDRLEAGVAAVVADARSDRLPLSAVVVEAELTPNDAKQIAAAIQLRTGGTALVVAASTAASHSESLPTAVEDAALQAATEAADPVDAVRAYVEVATDKPFPWSMVVIGALIVLVGVGVLERVRSRRQRRPNAANMDDLMQGLRTRVAAMEARITALQPLVQATGRRDITERAEAAMADREALDARLSAEVRGRSELDHAAGEVEALDGRLTQLERDVEAALATGEAR